MFSPNDAVVSGFKYQVSIFVLLVSLSVSSNIWSAEPIDVTTAIENFSQRMATEHGFSKESIDNLINGQKKKESILNAFSKPATSKPWSFFQKLYVTEFREKEGVKFWNKHLNLLLKAESEFGVPPEIITALIGIETNYGGYTGEFSIVDAFYTLGFYGERRNKYFLKEFEETYGEIAYVALSMKDYENLALNIADIRRYLEQQNEIIVYYEKAVTNDTESEEKK